jgi:hypothetical protein
MGRQANCCAADKASFLGRNYSFSTGELFDMDSNSKLKPKRLSEFARPSCLFQLSFSMAFIVG